MMRAFTRNYQDDSTEAGFQFTFYCDICQDGYKSSFISSQTYKKKSGLRGLTQGASVLGSLLGGVASDVGNSMERGGRIISDRFEERSPEWQKEHEQAFNRAQNEAKDHFFRCHSCQKWVCESCYNEEEGLCVECAPREDIYVAKKRADAMRRNIDEAADTATVWQGRLESKTTVCPVCGKPAGAGKFCNNCGAPMGRLKCPKCGAMMAQGIKFCNECGSPMSAPRERVCPSCGAKVEPGIRFCGECGTKVD